MESKNNNLQRKDFGFLKKVWYSMTKFEMYPEMAAYGVPRALLYLVKLLVIFSIVLTFVIVIFINQSNLEEPSDNSTFFKKLESRLDLKIDESLRDEMVEVLGQYEAKTLNILFVIASVISIFISYFIITIVDILILSLFGMITCVFTRIKVKYRAIFNMSVYAITISLILRLIYEILLLLFSFKVKYFDIMYTSIAYICLAAAIFMIRSDLIKQQIELMKVLEEKRKNAIEDEENQKEEQDHKKNEDDKKDENDQEKENQGSGEEQGSNA